MARFKTTETSIAGLLIIEPQSFGDERGSFMEVYNQSEFEGLGIFAQFVQDNESRSKKGVLRGLHYQTKFMQGKLVRAVCGEVYDVALDLRRRSPTFGRYEGVRISGENRRMLYIPEGFAHGFLALSDETVFAYKCTDFYRPEYEAGIIYNDADIGIPWPLEGTKAVLSGKDGALPAFKDAPGI